MSETVKIWVSDFEKNGRDLDAEIDETKIAISNERLWQKGALSKEEALAHEQNIAELNEYLEWLNEKRSA